VRKCRLLVASLPGGEHESRLGGKFASSAATRSSRFEANLREPVLPEPPGHCNHQAAFLDFRDRIPILESTLKAYIHEAIEVEKAGLKVDFKKTTEFRIPEEFQNELDEHPALKTAFDALTPGRQRAYILYFSAAKQSKTRASRVEKCVPQILDGKGLNDE
jgi:hypothetical protein